MSLQNFNPNAPIDLEELVTILLPDIYGAVRWACLRHQRRIRNADIDDFSQQIILMLIEDNCRRLRSFKYGYSFKTWLQAVVNHHIYKHIYRQKQTESLDEFDQSALIYSPPSDQEIYTAEKKMLLLKALSELSEQERLLYHLLFVSELDTHKIAAILGAEVKILYKRKQTARSQAHKARTKRP